MVVNQFPDRTIVLDNKELLYFGGTSYLGMATNVEFQQILAKSLLKWGSAYGSSRNSNIKLSVYDEFERYFADFTTSESSLVVSSGTLAGRLVIDFLLEKGGDFYHYPKTHPAVLAENSLPLFKNGALHSNIKNGSAKKIVITTDAILGGETETTNFNFLDEIPNSTNVTLVIDESHTLGLVGKNGNGVYPLINHPVINRKIMVSSLGKALGLACGIVASDFNFINDLKQRATFVSSSGANPAYLCSFLKASSIYKKQFIKLINNLNFIERHLNKGTNYRFNSKYPVIYSEKDNISNKLLEKGIVITSFKYPTYKNIMNRIVITANHTFEDLEQLIKFL